MPDRCVLFHINWAIDRTVPDRGLIAPVDHVNLNFNCSREDSVASVLSNRFEPVALSLKIDTRLES